jgi:hypothetical protein
VRWHAGARRRAGDGVHELPAELARTADALARGLARLTNDDTDLEQLAQLIASGRGRCLVTWCAASTWRRDVRLARLLWLASESEPVGRVVAMARSRVVEGPLIDALLCAPLLGDGDALLTAENSEAVARLAILIWEAGSIALEIPELGQWIWGSPATFDALVKQPAHSSLLGRVLAARCLEMASRGLPPNTSPALVGQTLQILQPLLLHPEPLVWVHAARALGRLTGALEQLEGTLLDWVFGDSKLLRQRAVTAFASLPADRLSFLSSQLVAILESPDEEDWVLAAVAAATPYLYFERHSLWERLAKRILGGDGGAVASRALARGLATLWRRGSHQPAVEEPLRELRDRARIARPTQFDELRRWIEVVSVTDPIDGAERDPSISRSASTTSCASPPNTTTKRQTRAPRASRARSRRPSRRRCAPRSAEEAGARAQPPSTRSKVARAHSPCASGRPCSIPAPSASRSKSPISAARGSRSPRHRRSSSSSSRSVARAARKTPRRSSRSRCRNPHRRLCARLERDRARARRDRPRYLPVGAQDRGPRRRLARAAARSRHRAQRALLAARRHHEGHRAGRGRRRAMARPLRGLVGAGHRPPGHAAAARDRAAADGARRAQHLLRPSRHLARRALERPRRRRLARRRRDRARLPARRGHRARRSHPRPRHRALLLRVDRGAEGGPRTELPRRSCSRATDSTVRSPIP